jgi:hypothetical protein
VAQLYNYFAPHSCKLHWLMELSSNFHGVSYLDVALGCGNLFLVLLFQILCSICAKIYMIIFLDCRVMKAVQLQTHPELCLQIMPGKYISMLTTKPSQSQLSGINLHYES